MAKPIKVSDPQQLFDKIEAAIKLASHLGDDAFDFIEGRGLHQDRLEIAKALKIPIPKRNG